MNLEHIRQVYSRYMVSYIGDPLKQTPLYLTWARDAAYKDIVVVVNA